MIDYILDGVPVTKEKYEAVMGTTLAERYVQEQAKGSRRVPLYCPACGGYLNCDTNVSRGDKDALLRVLRCTQYGDREQAHYTADAALLDFIGDDEARKEFETGEKWYA